MGPVVIIHLVLAKGRGWISIADSLRRRHRALVMLRLLMTAVGQKLASAR